MLWDIDRAWHDGRSISNVAEVAKLYAEGYYPVTNGEVAVIDAFAGMFIEGVGGMKVPGGFGGRMGGRYLL